MAILTGLKILEEVRSGRIVIDPFEESQINSNSYNLRLGDRLLTYIPIYDNNSAHDGPAVARNLDLDARENNQTYPHVIGTDGYLLLPGVLYLGHTFERTFTPHHVPCIEGRSSLARLGLSVHLTAGFGDVGYEGQWTLEITVVHPLRVYAGIQVCQIVFGEVTGEVLPYRGKYLGQSGPTASRLWQEL